MNKIGVTPDYVLDARNLCCPMPAVKTSLQLEKMKVNQVLEVLTTDPVSQTDLPEWCKSTGNELLGIELEGNVHHIFIKKRV